MPRILVADDHVDIVDALYQLLQTEGHEVKKAYTGTECLEKTKKKDVVLLDVMMPEINGYTVAKKLREKFGKEVVVIFVSAKPKQETDLSHVDSYIEKPFLIEDVLDEVNRWIKN